MIIRLGRISLVYAGILSTMPNIEIALYHRSCLLLNLNRRLFNTAKAVNDVKKLAELDIHSAYVKTPLHGHFPKIKTIRMKRR